MNNFVLIFRRRKEADLPDPVTLESYLVRKPKYTRVWTSTGGDLRLINFVSPPMDSSTGFHCDGDAMLCFDGFPDLPSVSIGNPEDYGRRLLAAVKSDPSVLKGSLSGEFSLVFANANVAKVTCSLGGSHALYSLVNEDWVAFSNRSPLLLALPSVVTEVSVRASSWFCYQGYLGGLLTPFKGVSKLPLGAVAELTRDGCLEIRPRHFSDITDGSVGEMLREKPTMVFDLYREKVTDYLRRLYVFYGGRPLRFRLSGGKDSRLVLSLLAQAGLLGSISSTLTRGPLYSPEVLAASDVCSMMGIKNHEIRRPVMNADDGINTRIVTNSINFNEGHLSVYDFMGINPRRELSVCGHQLTLRPGAYKRCRATSFDAFVDDAIVARFHDPWSILSSGAIHDIRQHFRNTFEEYRSEGTPVDAMGDLFLLRDRLLNWAAVVNNADYYSGPLTNPLLLPDIFRLSFSLPAELRSLEAIPFLWMKAGNEGLARIPFADDTWDVALFGVLRELGIPLSHEDRVIPPYKSHASFPDLANPLMPSLKVEYLHRLGPTIRALAMAQSERLSGFLDVDRLCALLTDECRPNLAQLYCMLGTYTDILLSHYGLALFHRERSADVSRDLAERVASLDQITVKVGKVGSSAGFGDNDRVLSHEKCVAELVRELQRAADETSGLDGEYVVDLPTTRVRQVRIDPLEGTLGEFSLRRIVLAIDGEEKEIPCLELGDFHQVIHAKVMATTEDQILFCATGENRPWLAPKGLSQLDLTQARSAQLSIKLKSSRGRRLVVYWDIGEGYNGNHCIRLRI